MKVKYKRLPHSDQHSLVLSFAEDQRCFNALEWQAFVKRMKESFPDVEFEEV